MRIVEFLERRQMLTGILVTTNSDDVSHSGVSLRDAVTQANIDSGEDTITFADSLAGQTIVLKQGELPLTSSMTITGLGAGQLTIDGNDASRIFDIYRISTIPSVTITGLTLQNGNGLGLKVNRQGGAIANLGILQLANNVISGNSAESGGGIVNHYELTSTNNTITGNAANVGGGGIYSFYMLTSSNDSITGNSAQSYGGGIGNSTGRLTVTNDTISGNTTQGYGGGIFNNSSNAIVTSYVIVSNSTITENSAQYGGGVLNFGTLTATNDTIAGNSAQQSGGGIYNDNSAILNATSGLIIGNTAPSNSDSFGTFTPESGYNLVGIPGGQSLSDILQTTAGGQPLLASNGGPTQTIALANNPLNPALGAGGVLAIVTEGGDAGTTLTVNSTTFVSTGVSLRIGTEIVTVTAVPTPTTLTVLRAQAGTTQTNLNGLAAILAFDQRGASRDANPDLGAFELLVATISNVTVASGTYTGSPFAVTNATVTGFMNQVIATFGDPSLSYTYYSGTLNASDLPWATPLSGAPVNVGNYTVVANYTVDAGYQNATSSPVYFSITPATLIIAAVTDTKVYDGTKFSSATPKVNGLVGSDFITNLTESYTQYSALGTDQSVLRVNPGFVISDGNGGANYDVVLPFALGTITPAALTIAPFSRSKTYDGTTSTPGPLVAVSGLIQGDILTGTAAYQSANVMGLNGSTMVVTSYSVGDGNGGGNYIVTVQTVAGTITPATLIVAAVTNTRVYDGTKSAAAIPTVTGLVPGDSISPLTESYTEYSALGTNQSVLRVNPGFVITDGNGGANYSVVDTFALGTITPAALTIAPFSRTKTYDGTTSTPGPLVAVSGLIPGDILTGTAAYQSKNVMGLNGSTMEVTSYSVGDGNGGGNYVVTLQTVAGTITPANLAIAAVTNNRVYDGTKSAAAIPTVTGLVSGDSISPLTESYTEYSALGTDKSVLQVNSGYVISDGNGGANYKVNLSLALGTITPAALTIAPFSRSKTFDGTTSTPGPLVAVSGLIPGDILTGTAAYQSKNVMGLNGSTMEVTSYSVGDGNGGGNYVVTVQTVAGTITPATLTVAAVTNTKVYDGTKSAAAIPTVTGLVSGDSISPLTESYTAYSALGTNQSVLRVNPGFVVTDGNGGANYIVVDTFALGTITPAALTISAVTYTKNFDGTTTANVKPTVVGLVPGESVTNLSEQFTSPDPMGVDGSTLLVDPGYIIGDGNGGNNYVVTVNPATGTILP